ncbi:MAG: YdeI/OmpD-associated family protein [Candidatus Dormibacteria bacterium]
MKFQATIRISGKTATGIEVPVAVLEGLGGGKRPAVTVNLNGYEYRSTVAPMGGVFMLPIEQAKTPETRRRRVEKAISDLREGRV